MNCHRIVSPAPRSAASRVCGVLAVLAAILAAVLLASCETFDGATVGVCKDDVCLHLKIPPRAARSADK